MRATSATLFLVTAAVGVAAAYDQQLAVRRFGLLALGLLLVAALAWIGALDRKKTAVGFAAYCCLWVAGVVAVVYLVDHSSMQAGPSAPETGLLQPAAPLASIAFGNATAGALILLLPIGVASLDWLWQRQQGGGGWLQLPTVLALLGLVPVLLGLGALIAADSRGAWFALGLGTVYAAYCGWRFGARRARLLRRLGDSFMVGALLLLVAGSLVAILAPPAGELVRSLTQDASARSRVQLWHDVVSLVQDYRFTGSGLGSMAMVYSTYVLLLHVVFLQHAHQLYLQIAVEQGLPGLVAFLWMAAAAVWALFFAFKNDRSSRSLAVGVTAALVAMLVHGLVDSELYASGLVMLVFVPFGFAWALQNASQDEELAVLAEGGNGRGRWVFRLAPVMAVLMLFFLPDARAALWANLGAVSQTKAELAVYSWPTWPIQDELRRSTAVDLGPAIAEYRAALALDPYNVTAHRRLGQIYLSRGKYQSAVTNLESAYSVAPDQRASRQLLGEAYAVIGNIAGARQLWQTAENTHEEFALRLWWYDHLGAKREGQHLRAVIGSLQ